jgi:hypothetical protein
MNRTTCFGSDVTVLYMFAVDYYSLAGFDLVLNISVLNGYNVISQKMDFFYHSLGFLWK